VLPRRAGVSERAFTAMSESHGGGLLAHLHGHAPPAPAWFARAIAQAPQRRMLELAGARIESLSWGERGKPGLLLMHGNGAHAHWWSFIAPFFARDWRVAAFSWSGMGGSSHRPSGTYSLDGFVDEMLGVAQAEGLFDGPVAPVAVAHSFGGFPTMACARRHGERLRAAVIVDSPLRTPEQRRERERARRDREPKPLRVYADFDEALMRFRFMPVQPCEHLYVVDHIARTSLREVPAADGTPGGWTWRFDPFMWNGYRMGSPTEDLAGARCPIAYVWGARSTLVTKPIVDYVRCLAPPGSPMIEIPDADHHVMVDQPLAFVAALKGLLAGWPGPRQERG
jgi:pimeloyl-ACP methyl ester carboxylesterase